MEKQKLINLGAAMVHADERNRAAVGGKTVELFEAPIFGFGSSQDALFAQFKQPDVIGPHFRMPEEWLPSARTVVSFFLPFAPAVRQANHGQTHRPGEEWLYGRIEGQRFVDAVSAAMAQQLIANGYDAVVPSSSAEFWTVSPMDEQGRSFTSNWSERHAAFVCGLGTFGLSKGLITEKGMAGRFGSVITSAVFQPTERPYTGIYEYCTRCGACIARCPGGAITFENGKSHPQCFRYQQGILPQLLPRYGCGLCQTAVPCETCIPNR